MQEYPVRNTHRKGLTLPAIEDVARRHFDGVAREGEAVVAHWGAIERLSARPAGKALGIELVMNPKVESAVASETIRRYNLFLQDATGFNAKERAKRLKKSSGE
jgi:hypothetical protein